MHDWKNWPELTNSQMDIYYLESPHKQILSDFRAVVVKVIDGDTIRVLWAERPFDFPVRMLGIDAPEMNEGGEESKSWLENQILGEEVDIIINPRQRVGKWGRILGVIFHKGMNVNEESMRTGMNTSFERRREGKIEKIDMMVMQKWS